MKKTIKLLSVSILFSFLFTGCFSWFSSEPLADNQMRYKLNDEQSVNLFLTPYKRKSHFSLCVSSSYTLKGEEQSYGQLFVEEINLSTNCRWNGLSTSLFMDLFKENLKLDSVKNVQSVDVKNYSFTTYRVNDEFYVNLILKYSAYTDQITVDYNGRLSKDMLAVLKPGFELKYLDRLRLEADYNDSLVLKSMFKGYFAKEGGRFEE